jgi:hypothetical protein
MADRGNVRPESIGLNTDKSADNASTAKAQDVDLEALAAEIYRLLKQDLRLERERSGRR